MAHKSCKWSKRNSTFSSFPGAFPVFICFIAAIISSWVGGSTSWIITGVFGNRTTNSGDYFRFKVSLKYHDRAIMHAKGQRQKMMAHGQHVVESTKNCQQMPESYGLLGATTCPWLFTSPADPWLYTLWNLSQAHVHILNKKGTC